MALYGHINEFNQDQENIADYLDRLSFYLEANSVTEENKKKAILLTVIGPVQFRLLKDLSAPHTPKDKTYDELTKFLKDHHSPAPPKFLCRAKFEARCKQPNETISEFVAALRRLSEYCDFGTTLDERLTERFVTGIGNIEVQRKLILESDLNLEKAIQIATAMQQSVNAARSINAQNTEVGLNSASSVSKHSSNFARS